MTYHSLTNQLCHLFPFHIGTSFEQMHRRITEDARRAYMVSQVGKMEASQQQPNS